MKGNAVELIAILLAIITGGAFLLIVSLKQKKEKKAKTEEKQTKKKSAQEFLNIKKIENGYLYSADGWIYSFLKITPIPVDLLSGGEEKALINNLTASLSGYTEEWNLIALSRTVDISPILGQYQDIKSTTGDRIQKELLKQEERELTRFAMDGEVNERQFYIRLAQEYRTDDDSEKELNQKTDDFASRLINCGIRTEKLKKPDIIRLNNLIHNPAVAVYEDFEDNYMPFLRKERM